LALVGLGIVIGGIVLLSRPEREPEYGGKRLSEWVEQIGGKTIGFRGPSDTERMAIGTIGTNAIPYLLEWILYEQPRWKDDLYAYLNSEFGWSLKDNLLARAKGAVNAFETLGPNAAIAIPELARLMTCSNEGEVRTRAVDALATLGNLGLPPLLAALTNRPSQQRITTRIIYGLATMRTNGQAAVPTLQVLLTDPSPDVSNAAVYAIWRIDSKALGIIPPPPTRKKVDRRVEKATAP